MDIKLYDKILKEHFDTSNRKSIRVLLSLNEADQNQAMVALASKLYEKIIDKVDDIDFGTIPASKGDITKIGNFQEMRECITIINDILVHYKQDTSQLDTVDRAIENLKDSKAIWEKAFAVKCEMATTFYNTIALSIVSSISLLISASIDFISEPGENQSFSISFNKVGYTKSKDKLLFQNLEKFNTSYAKGDIKKVMKEIVNSNAALKESVSHEITESVALTAILGVVGAGMLIGIILTVIIPILHELVCMLYCARQNVSDYFEVQAKLVQFNAENLKYDYSKSPKEVEKIYNKQMKIVDRFKSISNKFAIKMNKSDNDAKKIVQQEKTQKYNSNDIAMANQDIPELKTSSIF